MRYRLSVVLLMMAFSTCLVAQGNIHERSSHYEWPEDTAVVRKLKSWQDQKFGVLIHWGLYAVPGIVESWSICDEDWITRDTTRTYQQYKDWYWGLADSFRPTQFDPWQWAQVASEAGMRYMIFTSKHHDGFCLWDSRQTDFTVARRAFADDGRRDILRHVLAAFRSHDFLAGIYFSKPDWHSQYYWWDVYPTKGRNVNYSVEKYPWRWQQFQRYTYNQIEELMTDYGPVDLLWLDGGWVCPQNRGQDIDMPRIAAMARSHQPGLLMVDRTIHGPYENYQTPERTVPEQQLTFPWESCIPLSDDWGWVPRPRWKSAQRVVNTLIEVVAKGGNLVLGVGPTAEGVLQPEVVERLQEMGRWLKAYGEAIYATTTTPHYHDGDLWFTASKDGRRMYALLALPEGQELPATLTWKTNVPRKGSAIRLVGSKRKVRWSLRDDGSVEVLLPKGLPAESLALTFEPS
ncbi:MAG: alpha-L-fucosidase [Bacteroidaceae bacterium]|nr:alpha-L-fucosidase [Bacteroidaceae bacterium]